jgi:hypothetical protein
MVVGAYTIRRMTNHMPVRDKYPGINVDELDLENPDYSCIICKAKCFFQGCLHYACVHHEEMSTEEWNESKASSSLEVSKV